MGKQKLRDSAQKDNGVLVLRLIKRYVTTDWTHKHGSGFDFAELAGIIDSPKELPFQSVKNLQEAANFRQTCIRVDHKRYSARKPIRSSLFKHTKKSLKD